MIYPVYHMAGINDIFRKDDDYSFIKGKTNVCREYCTADKHGLAKQIFHTLMKKVIEDVVEEGVAFSLPNYKAAILVEKMDETMVDTLRSRGKLRHFSDIFAHGDAFDIIYRFKNGNQYYKKKIVIGSELYQTFVNLVNRGKKYFKIAKIW